MKEIMIPAWVDGALTPVEKLETHVRGLRHKAISVFVVRDGEILLQRRAMGKYHTPGLWTNTCCTHPHWGEAAEACAARRLREEMGIDGLALDACGRAEYRADVGGGLTEHEVVDIFRAEAPASLAIAANPDEVMDWRWTTLADLEAEMAAAPERFTPWLKIYLAEHRGMIFPGAVAAV